MRRRHTTRRAVLNPPQSDADQLETAADQAIAAFGGDAREAVKSLIVANHFLETKLEKLRTAVSPGMRAANCCRVIGRIGTTKDADGCLLLGEMQTSNIPGPRSENDPSATLAVPCGNGFDAGFSSYQSTRLSRYDAAL